MILFIIGNKKEIFIVKFFGILLVLTFIIMLILTLSSILFPIIFKYGRMGESKFMYQFSYYISPINTFVIQTKNKIMTK